MKKNYIILIVIAVVVAAFGGWFWWYKKKKTTTTPTTDKTKVNTTVTTQSTGNEAIKAIQRDLNSKLPSGYVPLVVDGIVGPLTEAAYTAVYGTSINKTPIGRTVTPGTSAASLEYKQLADALFGAMDGVGTNVDMIIVVVSKLKSVADWNALKAAFGTRVNTYGNFSGNLPAWIISEYATSPLQYLNLKSVLNKINVTEV